MSIQIARGRENAASGYTARATTMSLHVDDPGTTGANEVTGGSPAYARLPITWTGGAVDGTFTGSVGIFNVPGGVTVKWVGLWDVDGNLVDTYRCSDTIYPAQGVLVVSNLTYVQN